MSKPGGSERSIGAWSTKSVVDFYASHRGSADDLYASEKRFMGEALSDADTILDIGCAAGGFSRIVREYRPKARYTGVDISPAMIAEARKRFPQDVFQTCDGHSLPFQDRVFDACISLGVLHMTADWRQLLTESWRVCRRSFLFDLRVVEKEGVCDPARSYQKMAFDGTWDGVSTAPYVVISLDEIAEVLNGLQPSPGGLKAFGYWHPVSEMTVSPYREVCMAVFLLSRTASEVHWEIPIRRLGMQIRGDRVR